MRRLTLRCCGAWQVRRWRRFSFPSRSFDRLQIRCHGAFDTTQPRVVEQLTVLYAVSLSRETQRFEGEHHYHVSESISTHLRDPTGLPLNGP
jgi:hypothetical protein